MDGKPINIWVLFRVTKDYPRLYSHHKLESHRMNLSDEGQAEWAIGQVALHIKER
ncbi:hypothetical protein Lumi_085 [Xylophilus phage Lumi]|nr:hypothetical protein Lumi_085 [Xylophilus phage Lumi]